MKLPVTPPQIVETSNAVSVATAGRDFLEHKITAQANKSVTNSNTAGAMSKRRPPSAEPDILGDDDYESLPASAGLPTYMVAGAIAGTLEHCAMYPLDSIKTRMQSILPQENCRYRTITDAFKTISKTEGVFRTVRGINVVAMGAGPAHALYFSMYETMKRKLSLRMHAKAGQSPIANAIAGCCATFVHDAMMNPVEVVKHRLQMSCSPYKGVADCARTVYKQEGVRAFYRSFFTSFSMNAPFQVIHFMCYEGSQEYLNPHRHWNPWTHCASGALAGAIASFVTTPLDVCKTVLNTQEACVTCNQYTGTATVAGLKEALVKIHSLKGFPGFFSGVRARVLFQMPATALSWSVYELFKYIISSRGGHLTTVSSLTHQQDNSSSNITPTSGTEEGTSTR